MLHSHPRSGKRLITVAFQTPAALTRCTSAFEDRRGPIADQCDIGIIPKYAHGFWASTNMQCQIERHGVQLGGLPSVISWRQSRLLVRTVKAGLLDVVGCGQYVTTMTRHH